MLCRAVEPGIYEHLGQRDRCPRAPTGESSPGSGYPTITITTQPLAKGAIEIRIADNGSGVSEDVQPRLFDPFFTTKPVGKGMGLSISYQVITETHQGTLRVTSSQAEADRGTTFVIVLPTALTPTEQMAMAGSR